MMSDGLDRVSLLLVRSAGREPGKEQTKSDGLLLLVGSVVDIISPLGLLQGFESFCSLRGAPANLA